MSAATREEIQDLWRGINANHIAMELRAYRPGINFVGSTKGNIIDFLVRGEAAFKTASRASYRGADMAAQLADCRAWIAANRGSK